MKKPGHISIEDYNYHLPDEKIAKYPLENRADSKLLIFQSGNIEQSRFCDLGNYLNRNDHLIFNATKVVQARLIFRKESGARIEIFCLEPFIPIDYQLAFASKKPVEFICLIGNAKKWKDGQLHRCIDDTILSAHIIKTLNDKFVVRFSWNNPDLSFAEILERAGSTPIPPYLNREAEAKDAETYQTVYAKKEGSVAAPTAGLHFTNELLENLKSKEVKISELILHVGAGTFIPVKEDNALDHMMHSEHVVVNRNLLENLLDGKRIISVGTTTTRSLESLYWLGVKAIQKEDFSFENLTLGQWEAYALDDHVSLHQSIHALLDKMTNYDIELFSFSTSIMIAPGYMFKVIRALITNFHQPKSTLLLLIAAMVGDEWKKIYTYALENEFRFLSYGDSSLIYV